MIRATCWRVSSFACVRSVRGVCMYVQYVSTEVAHGPGESQWGVSHCARGAAEVIILSWSPWGLLACRLILVATVLSPGMVMWSRIKQEAGSESTVDFGVCRRSKQTTETNCHWRYGRGCSCFHFTPRERKHTIQANRQCLYYLVSKTKTEVLEWNRNSWAFCT